MTPQNPQNFSLEQLKAFASSPAGQQLLAMVQQSANTDFDKAQKQAASGNMEDAKKTLSTLLKDPKIQSLLQQFGG